MATKISDNKMTSDHTRHTAQAGCQAAQTAILVGDGQELAAAALVEAMDGSERVLLLSRLAESHPDVVEAGVAWLAEWRAEGAERRRICLRRREHDKRRQQRARNWTAGTLAG